MINIIPQRVRFVNSDVIKRKIEITEQVGGITGFEDLQYKARGERFFDDSSN